MTLTVRGRLLTTVPSRSEASNAIRPREMPNADDVVGTQVAGAPRLPVGLRWSRKIGQAVKVYSTG